MASWASMDNEGRGRLSTESDAATDLPARAQIRKVAVVRIRDDYWVVEVGGKPLCRTMTGPAATVVANAIIATYGSDADPAGLEEAAIIREAPAPATPNQARGPRSKP